MKFEKAVQHLEDLGLMVLMPNGKSRPPKKRPRRRNPVRRIPVRVLEKGELPPALREMIRRSRAEISDSTRK